MTLGMTSTFLLYLLTLLCFCSVGKPLTWIGKYVTGQFYYGDSIEINCSLTNPAINVSLWHKRKSTAEFKQRIPGENIQQNNQIFRIDGIKSNDRGNYQCRAANITPHKILRVYLSKWGIPNPKPSIHVKGKIKYGKDVTVECIAIGHVFLHWFKINATGGMTMLISTDPEYSSQLNGKYRAKQTLVIKSFNRSDDGVYRCLLSRPLVKWTAYADKSLALKKFEKPSFTSFPSSNEVVLQGKEHEFEYHFKGSPEPSLSWYKLNDDNTEELLSEWKDGKRKSRYDSKRFFIDDIGFILRKPSFPEDNMRLKCVAENLVGSVSRSFSVTVRAPPVIDDAKDTIHVIRNSPETRVVCKVKKANPRNLTYTWEKQSYFECSESNCRPEVDRWTKVVISKRKYHIASNSQNSTLTIKEHNTKIFVRCTANNGVGNDSHIWRVIILAKPEPLNALVKNVMADEGSNVNLTCTADDMVFKKVTWKVDDVDINATSRLTTSAYVINDTVYYSLHIRGANLTDGGKYKCVGMYNDKEAVADDISLAVYELKKPSAHLKSVRVANQSSFFKMSCNVTGYPKPAIKWSKDGRPLSSLPTLLTEESCSNSLSGIYRLASEKEDHMTVLIICDANYMNHSGWFKCTATNRLGNDSNKAFVEIIAPPVIRDLKPSYLTELGKQFALDCLSSGNPRPTVWWEKEQKDRKQFRRLNKTLGSKLVLSNVVEDDFGVYRCVAENEVKRETRQIQIVKGPNIAAVMSRGPDNSKKFAVVIGCVSFAVVFIVIIVAVVLYKRKKIYGGFYILTLPPLPDYIKKLDPGTPLSEQTNKLPYDPEWEFPRNRLKLYRELGSGAFGKVFLAEGMGIVAFDPRGSTKRRSSRRRFGGSSRRSNHYVNSTKMNKVAVKTLKEDSGEMEYKDLLSELKILIHVGEHKNIVNLLGACTKGRESDLWVIIEFCSNGNLLQFLRNRRDIYESIWMGVSKDPNKQLTMTDLVIVAYQIARGMEFLASRMCIHRDLATRNILVTENYVIKIADFGLARDLGQDSQYVKTSTGLLPIKWMAIEAIIERLFTEKSDVWSFGIVLWELFTLGGTPYPGISPNEVSEFLVKRNRMDPPHACPEEIASLMTTCWLDDRDSRPTFKELVEALDKIIEVHTSSEEGCGYLEVQGDEVTNDYLRPSEVKSPKMDPFECNSPLPPIPSPGTNETDSLLQRDQNARRKKFNFENSGKNNAARQDSEIEKIENDRKPDAPFERRGSDLDGYIDTSLTGKEKDRIVLDLDKDRDSPEEPHLLGNYAYWKREVVV